MSAVVNIRFRWEKFCKDCRYYEDCNPSPTNSFICFVEGIRFMPASSRCSIEKYCHVEEATSPDGKDEARGD